MAIGLVVIAAGLLVITSVAVSRRRGEQPRSGVVPAALVLAGICVVLGIGAVVVGA